MMARRSAGGKLLGAAALLMLAAGLFWALMVVPPDAFQGEVQRIMYLHVPSVSTAYLAVLVTFCASVLYLWKRDMRYDAVAVSSAEIAAVFFGITLATGSIWGKPTWGVWWTWDARLTLTAIVFTMYVGYLMLRAFAEDPQAGARYGAVLAILGLPAIVLNHFAVQWWRTLHQPSSLVRPGGPSVAPVLLWPLLFNILAMMVLYSFFLLERVRLERIRHRSAEARLKRGRRG
jgi:heme exporter protein C